MVQCKTNLIKKGIMENTECDCGGGDAGTCDLWLSSSEQFWDVGALPPRKEIFKYRNTQMSGKPHQAHTEETHKSLPHGG